MEMKLQISDLKLYEVITRLKLNLLKTHLMCISRSLCVLTAKIFAGTPENVEKYRQSGNMRKLLLSCQTGF